MNEEIIKTARAMGIPFKHIAKYLGVSRQRVLQISGEQISKVQRKRLLVEMSHQCMKCDNMAKYVLSNDKTHLVLCSDCGKQIIQLRASQARKKQNELYDKLLTDAVCSIATTIKQQRGGEIRNGTDKTDMV